MKSNPRFIEPNLSANLEYSAKFQALAADMGVAAASLAIAWLTHQGDHVLPIPGTRSVDHLKEVVAGNSIEVMEVIHPTTNAIEGMIETVQVRGELGLIPEVPLPCDGGGVAHILEHPRNRYLLDGKAEIVRLSQSDRVVIATHVARANGALQTTDALLIAPGHERRPRGCALRTIGIALRESHAVSGQTIQYGCLNIRPPVATQVSIAEIIG
jgi:hypothetical protein